MTVPGATAWSDRYRRDRIPWDLGGPHPELVRRLNIDPTLGAGSLGTAYVPGCGRGHDAIALAEAGWNVIASDFAPAVQADLSEALSHHGGTFVLGDSLTVDATVDLWFDHTFFCAIPLERRPEYGIAADRVVRTGGMVVSIVFPIRRSLIDEGPPYSMSTADLGGVLGTRFDPMTDEQAAQPARRRWPHRWAVWRRK